MNIVVTGAGGFLGKNLIKTLAKDNHYIYAIVNKDTDIFAAEEKAGVLSLVKYVDNYTCLYEAIEKPIDLFFHFAWSGTSGPVRNDELAQTQNIKDSCEALRLAIKIKCKRFVFFGSIMEFDVFNHHPLAISSSNTTMYSLAKYTAHYFTKMIAEQENIEYVSAIISNIYGPGEISKRFVYVMLNKMLNGETIQLSSCEQPYDFIYITDAIRQIMAIAQSGQNGKCYYIGNICQKRLKDFVYEMNAIVNQDAKLVFSTDTSNVIQDYYEKFSTEKTEIELGVKPEVSFKEGIWKTLQWIIENQ